MDGDLIEYSRRDPQDVLAALKQKLVEFSGGEWTDFTDGDVDYALVKSMIELQDMDSSYCDSNLQESFLSIAQLRESVIRLSKMLNYVPAMVQSAHVPVTITFPAFNTGFTIPANSIWTIQNMTFTCLQTINILANATSANIDLVQGTPYSIVVSGNNTAWQKITVPNNVSNLVVKVNNVQWTAVDSFIGVPSKACFKLYEDVAGLTILFGSNQSTFAPKSTDTISVFGLLSAGQDGNFGDGPFRAIPASIIRNATGQDVTTSFNGQTSGPSLNGRPPEDIDSIRNNAPAFYSTQGRCVTESDYEAFLFAKLGGLGDCQVVGGEKVGQLGKVIITAYPAGSPGNVSQGFLDSIVSLLTNYNVITVKVVAQAPYRFFFDLTTHIGVDPSVYTSFNTPETLVQNAISGIFDNLRIGQNLYESKLIEVAQEVPGIEFVNISIKVRAQGPSLANKIKIPVPSPAAVLTSFVLKDAGGNIIFQGDATEFVTNGVFNYTHTQADQICTLSFDTSDNVICRSGQMCVLSSNTVTSVYDTGKGSG